MEYGCLTFHDWISHQRFRAERCFRIRYPIYYQEAEDFGSWCCIHWLSGEMINRGVKSLAFIYVRETLKLLKPSLRTPEKRNRRVKVYKTERIQIKKDLMQTAGRVDVDPVSEAWKFGGQESEELKHFEGSCVMRDRRIVRRERIAFILCYKWGMSHTEIADVMGMTRSAVAEMIRKGLEDHRNRLNADKEK